MDQKVSPLLSQTHTLSLPMYNIQRRSPCILFLYIDSNSLLLSLTNLQYIYRSYNTMSIQLISEQQFSLYTTYILKHWCLLYMYINVYKEQSYNIKRLIYAAITRRERERETKSHSQALFFSSLSLSNSSLLLLLNGNRWRRRWRR